MKYYIADVDHRNGEFEDSTTIRFKAPDTETANKIHLFIVGTWYGEDYMEWDADQDCYMNDYIAIYEGKMTEIDEQTFLALNMHLTDLTPNNFEDVDAWLKRDAEEKNVIMNTYRVGVYYEEGTVLRIYADSPEQAKAKAQEEADFSY